MILQVPYYSQIKNTKNPDWKDKSCGIAALKMVLDFYQPTDLSIDELYQKGLDINGFLEGVGWYHHSLALLAKQLGYKAITRSWNIPKESLDHLKERGFKTADIEIIRRQQLDEAITTLKKELDNKHPTVVPIPKGFTKGGSGHLVVLIGYDEEGFICHDPLDGEKINLDYEKFKNLWEKRAILVIK